MQAFTVRLSVIDGDWLRLRAADSGLSVNRVIEALIAEARARGWRVERPGRIVEDES